MTPTGAGDPATDQTTIDGTAFVFNIVMTPGTIRYLQLFTRSLLAHANVRLRLVSNGCLPDELDVMHALAADTPGRVEVFRLPAPEMVPHGAALDATYEANDDGEYFCFVDSDVKAKREFMPMFVDLLTRADVVTSCNVAWSDDVILPPDAPDLVGRHSIGHDGFVYGSSYLAIYRRACVEGVRRNWAVTFRTYAYDTLAPAVQLRLDEMGRRFRLYDTAKVLNILLQGDGGVVMHVDNPALVHVGGISQYLSDPRVLGEPLPWFASTGAGRRRWDFAEWAAAMLRNIVDGEPEPVLPDEPELRARAARLRRELLDLAGQ